MSRRSPAPPWSSCARVLAAGALFFLAGWIGCDVDRSGLSSGVVTASGGQAQNPGGAGGSFGASGGSSVHFATGGAGERPGQGSGGQPPPETGGAAGAASASGGSGGTAGRGAVGPMAGSAGGGGQQMPGAAGRPGANGGGNGRAGGRGGRGTGGGSSGGGSSGAGNSRGSGGWTWGAGGAGVDTPMCDPALRDRDPCTAGAADCRKTCGVSERGTKPCTCGNRQWSCGDCAYPSGDYSCYQLPASGPVPPCPPNTVNGMTSCFGDCTLCANYLDTTGMPKMGYCACNQDPGDGQRLYHCASSSEWPPQ